MFFLRERSNFTRFSRLCQNGTSTFSDSYNIFDHLKNDDQDAINSRIEFAHERERFSFYV